MAEEHSEQSYEGLADTYVPHEAEAAEAIDAQLRRTSDEGAISEVSFNSASPMEEVSSVGGSYDQTEINEIVDGVNYLGVRVAAIETAIDGIVSTLTSILNVLRDSELIPTDD